jgi:hypothetical protein
LVGRTIQAVQVEAVAVVRVVLASLTLNLLHMVEVLDWQTLLLVHQLLMQAVVVDVVPLLLQAVAEQALQAVLPVQVLQILAAAAGVVAVEEWQEITVVTVALDS